MLQCPTQRLQLPTHTLSNLLRLPIKNGEAIFIHLKGVLALSITHRSLFSPGREHALSVTRDIIILEKMNSLHCTTVVSALLRSSEHHRCNRTHSCCNIPHRGCKQRTYAATVTAHITALTAHTQPFEKSLKEANHAMSGWWTCNMLNSLPQAQ